ncbi:ATG8-interacting protein 2-like [Macadamia integrifolia]|uniref:ATG8-interacting protein 2-like n=1 Tax=Macadamia integrifolia TaxID=60698 RepID=UPI001C530C9A|nr:ATG8-interacting protein 2-like [Macadamia integrifolia]
MANNEGQEASSRGNEWEVVSLTASTYSAAPGPKRVDDDKGNEFIHENPPLEPEKNEIDNEPKGEGAAANDLPMFDMNKFENEADVSGSTVYDKDAVVTESSDPSQKSSNNDSDLSKASVFVAAALMGLVILGQRWKQNKWASSGT